MHTPSGNRWVIRGVNESGESIRPSDWVERLSALAAGFGPERRLRYAEQLKPGMINGEKTLILDGALAQSAPAVFQQVMGFVTANRLQMDALVA